MSLEDRPITTSPPCAPTEPDAPVPLSSLKRGCRAFVHERLLPGDECELLAAMGLRDRCPLRVCRGGEPCIVQVAFTRLAMSAVVASKVMVRPTP